MKKGDKVRVETSSKTFNGYFLNYIGEDDQFVVVSHSKILEDETPQHLSVHMAKNVKRKAT